MWLLLTLGCSGSPAPDAPAPASPPPTQTPPDIVLVVVDTLRADRVGVYGHTRPTTPAIDALAAEGAWFTRAYAHSGWTLASFASLLTGTLPHEHRVGRDAFDPTAFGRVPAETVTLAETLQSQGYATAAFVNNTFLAPEFGLNQGFEVYDYNGATNYEIRSAPDTADAALGWLNAQSAPAFLLVHYMEPHLTWNPPESTRGRFTQGLGPAAAPVLELPFGSAEQIGALQHGKWVPTAEQLAAMQALYDEEVLAADLGVAALVAGLQQRPRWDQTLVVVTADHGEEMLDHGGFEHGHSLFGELTRVPLVVRGPGVPRGAETRVVSHSDLYQGLVKAAGATRPAHTRGDDLLALPPATDRAALSENTLYGPPKVSLVDGSHRLVIDQASGLGQVWAVAEDGSEKTRIQGEDQQTHGQRLSGRLEEIRGSLAPIQSVAGPRVPDFETFSRLQALGYIDPDAAPTDGP